MEEIRLLNKDDVVQIIDLMKTRSNMTGTNDVKIPDYSDWLYSDRKSTRLNSSH